MQTTAQTRIDHRSLFALLGEWLLLACLIGIAIRVDTTWLYVTAGMVIATRQHALLILFHDAVHGHLARRRRLNDALINLFVGVPALLPVEIYRPLHLLHHRTVGTAHDPERLLLYVGQPWNYRPLRPLALLRQLCGDLFLVNGVRTIHAWTHGVRPARIQNVTIAVIALWSGVIAIAALAAPETTLRALLLWFVPLLSVTQLLQKLRSFAEHSGGPGVTAGWPYWTYSWRVGPAGRATIWPYNINYHREHHDEPRLHWHELPGAGNSCTSRLDASRLWSLLSKH